MTDNDIKKALECCSRNGTSNTYCCDCSYEDYEDCGARQSKDALDLINRQQAEIEKLKRDCTDIDKFARDICKERLLNGSTIASFGDLQNYIGKQKTEVIKKFAHQLKILLETKAKLYSLSDKDCEFAIVQSTALKTVDNLVKEMTEVQE